MSENTINAALRRLGFTKDEMTAHGFRSAASSLLNESGIWNPDAIERQLAHVDNDSVRRAYARADYWEERVRMMAWWADRCDEMKRGGAVIPLADVTQLACKALVDLPTKTLPLWALSLATLPLT